MPLHRSEGLIVTIQTLCALLGFILVIDIFGWWTIPRTRPHLRVGTHLGLYILYSVTIFFSGYSPLQPIHETDTGTWQFITSLIMIIWWFLSARMLTDLLGVILLSRTEEGGRLLRDVLGALIFLATTVAAAAYVLQLPVKGLLATSGALACWRRRRIDPFAEISLTQSDCSRIIVCAEFA